MRSSSVAAATSGATRAERETTRARHIRLYAERIDEIGDLRDVGQRRRKRTLFGQLGIEHRAKRLDQEDGQNIVRIVAPTQHLAHPALDRMTSIGDHFPHHRLLAQQQTALVGHVETGTLGIRCAKEWLVFDCPRGRLRAKRRKDRVGVPWDRQVEDKPNARLFARLRIINHNEQLFDVGGIETQIFPHLGHESAHHRVHLHQGRREYPLRKDDGAEERLGHDTGNAELPGRLRDVRRGRGRRLRVSQRRRHRHHHNQCQTDRRALGPKHELTSPDENPVTRKSLPSL